MKATWSGTYLTSNDGKKYPVYILPALNRPIYFPRTRCDPDDDPQDVPNPDEYEGVFIVADVAVAAYLSIALSLGAKPEDYIA
jgi:hypothetical protein